MTDNSEHDRGARPRAAARAVEAGPPRRSGPGARAPREAEPDAAADADPRLLPAEERIAKVIARAGIASRRDAEAMIEAGRVTLDGKPVASPALNVGPDARIAVDGEPLPLRERTRLWLFHKPRGLVTTFKDPQGRPTVFDALPEEMPRVVAIGRLDMNTEGLLLLTNDGGLAKVVAQPDTGWTRRYKARAFGEITQEELDKLRRGVTVDEMEYGPIEAHLDRVQGDNCWITLALKEGKNREVKRVLEHVGLQVNRLIRVSFGPFQLGDLESGLVEEVRTRVLKDQLGKTLAEEAGVDFESPVREPIAPFGIEKKRPASDRPGRRIEPRRASEPGRGERIRDGRPEGRSPPKAFGGPRERPAARERPDRERPGGERPGGERPERARPERGPPPDRSSGTGAGRSVWRAEEGGDTPRRRTGRREDPKAEREASLAKPRERIGTVTGGKGRRVVVERVAGGGRDEAEPHRRDRAPRPSGDERPARPPRPDRDGPGERPARGKPFGDRPAGKPFGKSFGKPAGDRPARGGPGGERFGGGGSARPGGDRPGFGRPPGRPGAGRPAGDRPRPPGRPGGGKPGGFKPGGFKPGGGSRAR